MFFLITETTSSHRGRTGCWGVGRESQRAGLSAVWSGVAVDVISANISVSMRKLTS